MKGIRAQLFLVVGLLGALLCVLFVSQGPDHERHYALVAELRELSRLDGEVGRAAAAMRASPDGDRQLAADLEAMQRAHARLTGATPAVRALGNATQMLDAKVTLGRYFIVRSAMARVSTEVIPVALDHASRRIAATGNRALERALTHLGREVFVFLSTAENASAQAEVVAGLALTARNMGARLDREAVAALGQVVALVDTILRERPELDRLAAELQQLTRTNLYDAALAENDGLFSAATDRSARLRFVFYALAVLSIILVCSAFWHLREQRRRLEQRVQERTRDLVRAEELARSGEQRLRALVNASLDGIALLDRDGRLTDLNPAAERIAGLSRAQAIHQDLAAFLVAPADRADRRRALAACLAVMSPGRLEVQAVRIDGTEVPVELAKVTLAGTHGASMAVFLRDMSAARRLEAELHHAQKLEAVGRLAAGIAHEINTPVQFVGDSVRFLEDAGRDLMKLVDQYEGLRDRARRAGIAAEILTEIAALEDEIDLEYIREQQGKAFERALDGVQRVATIVRAMKEFGRPDLREKAPADLNRALESTITVASNELKYVADVVTDFGAIPLVNCYLSDVNQVFLNLLVNAAHAVADAKRERGTINVRTRLEPNGVVVSIADNGCGVPAAIQRKIFEPFFTTKEVGRGTGQGLAIAHAIIVEKHQGALWFDSSEGAGTTFHIRFPLADTMEQAA